MFSAFFKLAKNEIHAFWDFPNNLKKKNQIHVFWAFLILHWSQFSEKAQKNLNSAPNSSVDVHFRLAWEKVEIFSKTHIKSYRGRQLWGNFHEWILMLRKRFYKKTKGTTHLRVTCRFFCPNQSKTCFKSKIFDSSNPFQDQIRRKHNLFGLFKVKRAEKSKKALFASSKKPNSHDLTILAYKQATVSKRWLKKTNEFCKMLKSESITSLSFQKVNSCGCRFFLAYKASNWR